MSDACVNVPDQSSPTSLAERISSLDVLRGVAVLGILLMNIVAFGMPSAAYNDPSTYGGSTGVNLATWIVTNVLFEGTFRTMFSLLFGASVILFLTRAEQRCNSIQAADLYFRRSLWLIVFGVIHAYLLLWVGEILYAYGVTALLLFAFRHVGPRKLLIIGLMVLAVLVPKRWFHAREVEDKETYYLTALASYRRGDELTRWHVDAFAAWRKIELTYKPAADDMRREIEMHQGSYLTNLRGLAPINTVVQAEWYYRWNFWDVLGAMFIGMALLKLRVLSAERSQATYVAMAAIGYCIGLAVNIWETKAIIDSQFHLMAIHRTTLTYDVGRLAMTAGHVGLVLWLCKSPACTWLWACLAAVGRMALTNYVMQTVICVTLFSGFGCGLYGELQRYQLYYVVAAIWLVQLLSSPLWLRYCRFGPVEWLWRSLTYGRLQPIFPAANDEPPPGGSLTQPAT